MRRGRVYRHSPQIEQVDVLFGALAWVGRRGSDRIARLLRSRSRKRFVVILDSRATAIATSRVVTSLRACRCGRRRRIRTDSRSL